MTRPGTGGVLNGVMQCGGRYGRLMSEAPFCRAMLEFAP